MKELTMFKHTLGNEALDIVTKLDGIITARSENLFGCNRYFIQPAAGTERKVPDGWWVDEDQVQIKGPGVVVSQNHERTNGGPMSRIC